MILARKRALGQGDVHSGRWDNRRMAVVEPHLGGVRELRLVIALLTVAVGVATVLLVPHSSAVLTTYSGGSGLARTADIVAGLSLLAAGLATLIARPHGSIGIVAMLAGAAWFAPDWVGWEGGPPLVRSIGMVVAPFVAPLLFHVVLAAPNGPLGPLPPAVSSSSSTGLLQCSASAARSSGIRSSTSTAGATARTMCSSCTPTRARRALDASWLRLSLASVLLVAALACWRLLSATRPGGRCSGPFSPRPRSSATAEATYSRSRLSAIPPRSAASDVRDAVPGRAGASTLARGVALGVDAYVVLAYAAGRCSDLAVELGEAPAPGSLRTALARALGDPSRGRLPDRCTRALRRCRRQRRPSAGRWPGSGRHTDRPGRAAGRRRRPRRVAPSPRRSSSGRSARRPAGRRQRATAGRGARPAATTCAPRARASSRPATPRGAASSAIFTTAPSSGCSPSPTTSASRVAARRGGTATPGRASVLAQRIDQTQAALDELRELAHGIYPAILTEAGLGPALCDARRRSAAPRRARRMPDGRALPTGRRDRRLRRRRRGDRRRGTAGRDLRARPRGAHQEGDARGRGRRRRRPARLGR